MSEYRFNLISSILNSQEPEIYSRELLKSFRFNKLHENSVRIEFRKVIADAYENGIALGLDTGKYNDLEEAYMARQKYLSKFYSKYSFNSDISNLLICIFLAMLTVFLILLFS